MSRLKWKSKLGFILAAAGSAIGLGNIVFFPANAYRFGGGAFYIPYLFALVFLGLPVIIIELALGKIFSKGFPESLRQSTGFKGEVAGWFAVLNSFVITMYYIAILGWVFGMFIRSFGPLWHSEAVAAFNIPKGGMSAGMSNFFNVITGWSTIFFIILVLGINFISLYKGTKTIERLVKVLVPAMWIFMLVIIIRALTLKGGPEGMMTLFTPEMSVLSSPKVWQGAFSQIFFTLSLGFGVMTTYASYLPKDSDIVNDGITVTFMNCTFEMIAGIAVFSLLFIFSIAPKASTLSMMFFIMPAGIAKFPQATVTIFGVLFFLLLLIAGLTSSISLLETIAASVIDKFKISRTKALIAVFFIAAVGSTIFALPIVIDPKLNGNGTLGLSLLDLFDHWAFGYGLLLTGLMETILIGWFFGTEKIRNILNETSSWKIGKYFDYLIKYFIPLTIIILLSLNIKQEITGIYGHSTASSIPHLEVMALITWLVLVFGGSFILAKIKKGGENE